jgi:hypothetical protein
MVEQEKAREDAEKKKEVKKNAQVASAEGLFSRFIQSVKVSVLHMADRVLQIAVSVASRVKNWFVKEESIVKAREKTLKLKKEDDSKPVVEESPFSKEVAKKEDVKDVVHHEVQKIEEEAQSLKKEALKEEAQAVHSFVAEAEQIRSELESPFKLESHPVSVMPQEPTGQPSHKAVEKFGPPPTEGASNHPAFSHIPSLPAESAHQKGEQALSPFAK